MTSAKCSHQNHEEIEIDHKSLRLFDLHENHQSKIPVLVNKPSVANSKKENWSAKSYSSTIDDNPSRIPIYKFGPTYSDSAYMRGSITNGSQREETETSTPKKRSYLPPERHHPEYMSIKSRKTIKLHGLELTAIPDDIFDRQDLESLILSPQRESCLDVSLIHKGPSIKTSALNREKLTPSSLSEKCPYPFNPLVRSDSS